MPHMAITHSELPLTTIRTWDYQGVAVRLLRDRNRQLTREESLALQCVADDCDVPALREVRAPFLEVGHECSGGLVMPEPPRLLALCTLRRPSSAKAGASFVTVPWADNPYSAENLDQALDISDALCAQIGPAHMRALCRATHGYKKKRRLSVADCDELAAYVADM